MPPYCFRIHLGQPLAKLRNPPMTKAAHRRHAPGELLKRRRLYQHEPSLLPAAGASPVVVARRQFHHCVEFYCHPRHYAQGDLEEVCIETPQHCLQARTKTKCTMLSREYFMYSMAGQLKKNSGKRRCTYMPKKGGGSILQRRSYAGIISALQQIYLLPSILSKITF